MVSTWPRDFPGLGTGAQRFAEREDWRSAAAIYRTILEEFAELDSDSYYDEDGSLAYAISGVVEHMRDDRAPAGSMQA